ncbi:MAG: hypothetical protein R2880_08200 [Deinococcales bacterium]
MMYLAKPLPFSWVLIMVVLSACTSVPVSFSLNLLDSLEKTSDTLSIDLPQTALDLNAHLGDAAQSELRINAPVAGIPVPLTHDFPHAGGQKLDLSDLALDVSLKQMTLDYVLEVYSIGQLTGQVSIQAYLAADDGSALIAEAHRLGDPFSFNFDGAKTLTESITLSPAQVASVNTRKLRFLLRLEGNATVGAAGDVGLGYRITSLKANDLVIGFDAKVPEQTGVIELDNITVPPALVGLILDYDANLSYDRSFVGMFQVQLYVAPADVANIWQEAYRFGPSLTFNLSQKNQQLKGSTKLNQAQFEAVIRKKGLRYGAIVTGEVTLPDGGNMTISYKINKLSLTAQFAIL